MKLGPLANRSRARYSPPVSGFRSSALVLLLTGSASAQDALVIENVTLIDGTTRPPSEGVAIVIEGDRIRSVSTGAVALPTGARRIDGSGKWAIPGLMDMHVHLQRGLRDLHGYLYCGVTSIYDAGNDPEVIFPLRERERAGEIVSPRIFATGSIVTAPGGHGDRGATTVELFARDREKLDLHIAQDPDLLKITQDEHGWGTRPMIRAMPPDLLEEVIRHYHEHGIRTTIHVSNERNAWEAVYAGVDTLAHPVIQAPVSDRYLNMMRVKRIPQVSTLTIGEGYSRLVEHPEFLDEPLYRATLSAREIDELRGNTRLEWQERRWTLWMKVMTPVAQENLKRLHEAGGVVVLGTDQSLGAAVHRELELLVEGGIPPLDALRIGTLHGAIFLGREKDLGTIEPGKLADLVLLDADPATDIKNAGRIHLVIKGGAVIDRSRLAIPGNGEAQ
jgi:imidazolonepropionase-like amidohydrolase